MTFKIIIYHLSFLSFLTFYVAKRPFPNAIRYFSWCKNDVTSEIQSSDDFFNAACELSQPMRKTISIFHVCMVWIEKSVTRVTDRHHEACRVMPISDPE